MAKRWRILAILFLARISMAVQFQAVAALAPVIMREFGVGLAEIGVLIGLYVAPGMVIAYPGGAIGRRLGDRRAVAIGMVLMIAGGGLMALGTGWEAQLAGRLIAGTGGVVLNVLMSKMVQDWFTGREIATAMGIFVNSWPVGIAAALVVLPVVADAGGYAAAAMSVTGLAALGLVLFLAGYRAPDIAGASGAPRARLAGAPLRGVLLGGAIWALFNAALGTVFGFGPAMLAERGWSLAEASSATSVVMWMVALSGPLGGVLADRTGRGDTILVGGVLVFGAAMVAIAILGQSVVALFVVLGLASGLAVGPILSLPAEVLTPETRAPGMGIYYTLFYAVAVTFPALAGHVADGFGSASITFPLGAACLLACLPLLAMFRLSRRGVVDPA
jgi:MFS family permease